MKNKTKLILFSAVLIIFVSVGGYVWAQTMIDQARENLGENMQALSGNACGFAQYPGQAQGHCKAGCDPYEDILDSTTQTGQNTCLPSEPTCCAKTYCSANSLGVGTCKSSGSCGYGAIGTNTSDCLPPKICCVAQGTSPILNNAGTEVDLTPINQPGQTDVFTGEKSGVGTSALEPIVPCEGFDCSLCSIFKLIQNIINFLIQFTFAIAGGFIVWGAIEIMTDAGSEKRVESGRDKITTSVIGIAIMLTSWLFIGFILQILTNSNSMIPWNKIDCSSAPLSLKQYDFDNNDYACTSKGGFCQDSGMIKACENGRYEENLCKASSRTNKNIKCCVPALVDCEKITGYTCVAGECPGSERISGICPSSNTGAMGHCCPKGAPTTPETGLNIKECSGTCRSNCNNNENQVNEICTDNSKICCKPK